jgi:Domain of unknown function (DUF305)
LKRIKAKNANVEPEVAVAIWQKLAGSIANRLVNLTNLDLYAVNGAAAKAARTSMMKLNAKIHEYSAKQRYNLPPWLRQSMPTFLILAAIGGAISLAEAPPEGPFLAENEAAMTKMMAAMTVKPSGDVDGDFVAMMTPHHQGAIDMAQAFLRYGSNEQLRRIAQEIIVEQQQEIAAMRLALEESLSPSAASPDRTSAVGQTDPQTTPHDSMSVHQKP